MLQTNAKGSLYPKKILLALFIFGLVILAGKIIYSQFDLMSLSFNQDAADTEFASIAAPEFFHQQAIARSKLTEPSLALYRSDVSKSDVIWFYSHITGNEAISRTILDNASKNNIAPSLAFALAWEESRYQPQAMNKNSTSVDRGLFQLNNKAFPKLTDKDFYNPETNAHFGLSHLSYCIDLSGNMVAALAMYNAGTTKVRSDMTPKRTLDYVSRILNYQDYLEKLFSQQVAVKYSIDENDRVKQSGKR